MVLKLYGTSKLLPYVHLVEAVLLKKQVPFKIVMVNVTNGKQKTPVKTSLVKFLALYVILPVQS